MYISTKELNAKTPDISRKTTSIHFLDDTTIAKQFLLDDIDKIRLYYKKALCYLEIGKKEGLYYPFDILETENGFCGYIEPMIPGTKEKSVMPFVDYYNMNPNQITLQTITNYILSVIDTTEKCHEYGIVNPDLCSDGNVLFNPITQKAYVTDYQDMQVKDIPTDAFSRFYAADPFIPTPKYRQGDLWTPNIDWYIIAIRYLYFATRINLPEAILRKLATLDEFLEMMNLSNTMFGEYLRTVYNLEKENTVEIKDAIIALANEYEISEYVEGEPRYFYKK